MITTNIDEAFLKRVYKTSLILWVFGVFVCQCISGWQSTLGWTIGCLLSAGILASLQWIVPKIFVPGGVQAKGQLLWFSVLKFLALIALLSGVVFLSKALGAYQFAFIIGFFAGGLITQFVIFLKTIGLFINERLNR